MAGNSDSPELTEEERKEALAQASATIAAQEKAAEGIKEAARSGRRPPPETTLRVFLCPKEPNTTFLVKAGAMVSFRDPNSPTGKRDAQRDGDIFARFVNGVLATDDPVVIEWCEGHGPDAEAHKEYHRKVGTNARACTVGHGLCCDAQNPQAEVWAEFKSAQVPTATREATMPTGIDVDAILTGGQLKGHTGGEGTRLVQAAEATRKAAKGVAEDE
jgi:hypothetical protein